MSTTAAAQSRESPERLPCHEPTGGEFRMRSSRRWVVPATLAASLLLAACSSSSGGGSSGSPTSATTSGTVKAQIVPSPPTSPPPALQITHPLTTAPPKRKPATFLPHH